MLTGVIAGARGRRTSQARTGRGQSARSYLGLWTRSAEKGRGGWYYRAKEEERKGLRARAQANGRRIARALQVVDQLAAQAGLTETQVDDMFRTAAAL